MRDALALPVTFEARAFVLLRRASHFLSLAREKVTKERGTPLPRVPGVLPGKSASRGRAFRQGIGQLLLRCLNSGIHAVACPGEKASTSMPMPAMRPVDPASPLQRGPG
jgi:hypothetical protein